MKQDPVLELLRARKSGFVSGEAMSRQLNVSRAAVWKGIENLRALGYRVESRAGEGYRLAAVPDRLFADEIAAGLRTKKFGRRIFSYDELDSTNDAAFRLGEQGVPEGACVFAEHQRKGRGRLGRHWVSPKGKNLLFSALLRPALAPAEASKITLTAAVSVARTAERFTGARPGIKWPNDVQFRGRKVCGILTEMSAELDRVNFVVLGIGVNVNAVPSELPPGATSLRAVAGKKMGRLEFARALLERLESDYARLRDGRFEAIAQEWEELSVTSGARVTATVHGRKVHGQATGIDADGALWIRKDNGLQERVLAGDVESCAS